MTGTNELTLVEATRRLRDGTLEPAELLDDCLTRIRQREPMVGAWEYLVADNARQQAERAEDRRGGATQPLHGIPVGIKDIVDVAGMPTRCGTPIRDGPVASLDAWCVRRLQEAGAIVLGKTVTTEFAYFSPGRTRNPHDLDRTPGGSSSGSTAAVADHMTPIAIGTQTAGSTIRPAAYCGVVGFVPSPGRVPLDGIQHLAPTLDRIGLLARTPDDVRMLYTVLTGTAVDPRPRRPRRVLTSDGTALTDIHPAMQETMQRVAEKVRRSGVPVAKLGDPALKRDSARAQQTVMAYEAARNLADVAREHRTQLSDQLLQLIDTGAATSDAEYHAALGTAHAAQNALAHHLTDGAVLLAPAAPGPAPAGTATTGDPVLSRPWQILGCPALTLPAGTVDGMPLGIQLVTAPGQDATALATASWLAPHLSCHGPDASALIRRR